MQRFLLLISLIFIAFGYQAVQAQNIFPVEDGSRAKYSADIRFNEAYVSGVCAMICNNNVISSSIFNEFGISVIDFSYNRQKEKIKLHSVIYMLDKWYIKRVLKKDLLKLMKALQAGEEQFIDKKHKLTFIFKPL